MRDLVAESMIASGLLDGVVLLLFVFRLWIRIRMQRVGWEDIWATVAFVCGALNAASNWVLLVNLGAKRPATAVSWVFMFTFTCLVWAVRISILLSIIRIIPARERLHAYGLSIITFFLLSCTALVVEKAVLCTYAYHATKINPSTPYSRCNHTQLISICDVAVGGIADIVTVVFPLYVLRNLSLPSSQLFLLRILFSSTIMVSITCLIGLAFHVVPALSHWSIFFTNFQIATCLIVCNLLVVVTYLYRVLGCKKHGSDEETTSEESRDASTASAPRQMTLTTIDLLFSADSGDRASFTSGEGPEGGLVSRHP